MFKDPNSRKRYKFLVGVPNHKVMNIPIKEHIQPMDTNEQKYIVDEYDKIIESSKTKGSFRQKELEEILNYSVLIAPDTHKLIISKPFKSPLMIYDDTYYNISSRKLSKRECWEIQRRTMVVESS